MSIKKVLHVSTHDEDCGVAKYQENYLSFYDESLFEHRFYDTSPNIMRHLKGEALEKEIDNFKKIAKQHDIVHIQLEYGLYNGLDFKMLCEATQSLGKKLVVTLHISPAFAIRVPERGGLGPRSILHYLRQKKHYDVMKKHFMDPIRDCADLVIVHNQPTKTSLATFGVEEGKIEVVTHPVIIPKNVTRSDYIAKNIGKNEGDIIYGIVGFFHRYKGIFDAVKALSYLPENYKLAIIGGTNPQSHEQKIYNQVTDMIRDLGLCERVFITGYVEDDNDLYSYIKETDICVLPYDTYYYSHVSSGPVNIAMGLGMPTITYKTLVFEEMNTLVKDVKPLNITKNPAYYELARSLKAMDLQESSKASKAYAHELSWEKQAKVVEGLYSTL